ncbi:MAG: VWA domain-containing protein [Actinobacteria bacterium]|nr:VWA domain-containing protein [Actinomycetota bacterium]
MTAAHLCRRVRRIALASFVLLAVSPQLAPAQSAQSGPAAGPPRIVLAFDASESMKTDYGDGRSKIAAAQDAAVALLEELPSQTLVGLRVFGGSRPSRPIGPACRDSKLVLPIGPLDRDGAERQIRSFKAIGRTPIAHALEQAAEDLGDSGSRTIVLVSDGKDTCVPPQPCEVAERIAKGGVEMRIQAIGLDVKPDARRQLQCIASAGGGVYRDAENADQLRDELRTLSTRALREYLPRGKRVRGGRSAREATAIGPGQYVDEIAGDSERWYAVELRRGETLQASASFIPPTRVVENAGSVNASMDIVTPGLDIPDRQNSSADGSPFDRRGYVDGLGVVSRPIGVGDQADPARPFSEPGRYLLKLELEDSSSKDLFQATGGAPVTLELAVDVLGRRGADPGAGEPAKPGGPSLPAAPAAPDEPPSAPLLAAIGGGAGALGFLAGMVAWRRRRS